MQIQLPDDFDFGDLDEPTAKFIKNEIEIGRIYECYARVKPGDIVMDIGACFGLFTYRSLRQGAARVYCVEPARRLIDACIRNTREFVINQKNSPVVFLNHAIGAQTDSFKVERSDLNIFGSNKAVSTISFADIIKEHEIEKIDFLKIDCEGGEYDIFTDENLDFLTSRVDFIACELHGRDIGKTENLINRFSYFIKEILPHFPYHRFVTGIGPDVVDVTEFFYLYELHPIWSLMQSEAMLYISKYPFDYTLPIPLAYDKINWN